MELEFNIYTNIWSLTLLANRTKDTYNIGNKFVEKCDQQTNNLEKISNFISPPFSLLPEALFPVVVAVCFGALLLLDSIRLNAEDSAPS